MTKSEPWKPVRDAAIGTWTIDFRVEGRRIRRRLPMRSKDAKEEAFDVARKMYRDAWRDALEQKKERKITLHEAAKLYVQAGGEQRFLPPILGYFSVKIKLDDIDDIRIEEAASAIYPNAKPDTRRRQLYVPLRAIQNFSRGTRRTPSQDIRRTRWLTPEEAERLLTAAASPQEIGLRDPQHQTLRKIAFMLGTGVGPGETMSLTTEGWNPATREWWVPGTKTLYRARFVILPQRTIDLIGDPPLGGRAFPAPNGQPYVMGDNRGGQMAEAFRKVREAAELGDDVVPYTLRHTWATWFYAQTKDWAALLDQGGWNRSDTANRYRKIAPRDLARRLFGFGWDFRTEDVAPVRYGEYIQLKR